MDGHTVLVRRVKDVIFLRTINGSAAAYPGWSPEQIHKAARRALKGHGQ